ncbi:hypothetical protein KM043_000836 [Ampulex compressa]|nr:hypothetical protein KM043_000836 [Ampulex compressa]
MPDPRRGPLSANFQVAGQRRPALPDGGQRRARATLDEITKTHGNGAAPGGRMDTGDPVPAVEFSRNGLLPLSESQSAPASLYGGENVLLERRHFHRGPSISGLLDPWNTIRDVHPTSRKIARTLLFSREIRHGDEKGTSASENLRDKYTIAPRSESSPSRMRESRTHDCWEYEEQREIGEDAGWRRRKGEKTEKLRNRVQNDKRACPLAALPRGRPFSALYPVTSEGAGLSHDFEFARSLRCII